MRIAQGEFTRKPPAQFGERVELPLGWAVIRLDHLNDRSHRREVTYRWAAIICGKKTIFRILRFSGNLPRSEIVLDWPGWIDLQARVVDIEEKVTLKIRTPYFWEYPIIPFKHVDPGYRMSAWLGAISIGLGILSLGLAFLV